MIIRFWDSWNTDVLVEIKSDYKTITDEKEKFDALNPDEYTLNNFIEYLRNHGIKATKIEADADIEF